MIATFENQTADYLRQLEKEDKHTLVMLMKGYYTDLYNYGCSFCKDKELVKDCIQEVFISLWNRRGIARSIVNLRFYLLGAVKNQVLKSLNKNPGHTVSLDEVAHYEFHVEFSIEKKIIDEQLILEQISKLKTALDSLSSRQKELIYFKFYQYASTEQIAALMSISPQSAYS